VTFTLFCSSLCFGNPRIFLNFGLNTFDQDTVAMPGARRTRAQQTPALDITPAATPVPKGKKKKVAKKNISPSHQRDAQQNTNDLLMQIVSRLDGMDTNMTGMRSRLSKVETKPSKKAASPV
jgi:hypothetical protein